MTTIRAGNVGRNDYRSQILIQPGTSPFWRDSIALHLPAGLSRQESRHFGGIGLKKTRLPAGELGDLFPGKDRFP